MPNATIDPAQYERKELTSLPAAEGEEAGYVSVRPLPFGMKLKRRDKATRMYMEANPGKTKQQVDEAAAKFEIETMNEWATVFDFSYCIGEHNLTDVNGVKLDFTNPMTLALLNPRVGTEIETILSAINGDDDEESMEDFIKQHTSVTQEDQNS